MKKISLLCCLLMICGFGLIGCGSSSVTEEGNEAIEPGSVESLADFSENELEYNVENRDRYSLPGLKGEIPKNGDSHLIAVEELGDVTEVEGDVILMSRGLGDLHEAADDYILIGEDISGVGYYVLENIGEGNIDYTLYSKEGILKIPMESGDTVTLDLTFQEGQVDVLRDVISAEKQEGSSLKMTLYWQK